VIKKGKKQMNQLKPSVIIGCFVALCALSCTPGYFKARSLTINDPDLSNVADGIYRGVYGRDTIPPAIMGFDCVVTIAIGDHVYKSITIDTTRTSPRIYAAKGTEKRVVEKQSLLVDAVGGATISGKALLKAIENGIPTDSIR
jgi:uncharacterized protein with FMN-binding domain